MPTMLGAMVSTSRAIHAIGQGMATARGLDARHAAKQVSDAWVRSVVGAHKALIVVLDWTDFDPDGHSTLCLQFVSSHGRSTPLRWKTVLTSSPGNQRNDHEDQVVADLRRRLPPDVRVTLRADRGFGDQQFYGFLSSLGVDYVIRFRAGIQIEDASGVARKASEWVPANGRATMMRDVAVTSDRTRIPAAVLVKKKDMKQAWCLATSRVDLPASGIVALYGKRFTIEESFRDTKDLRFGMGLSSTHIGRPDRRDRLLLISALAIMLLTLLGAAVEMSGIDKWMKVNTSRKRQHSLLRQGTYYFLALPRMKEERATPLMAAFARILQSDSVCQPLFCII